MIELSTIMRPACIPCIPAHMASRHRQHRIVIEPDLILRESTGLKQR
jgi:hypothetical protein